MDCLALFGPVAGANGAWRVAVLVFDQKHATRQSADALIASMKSAARSEGSRVLMAELPADDAIGFSLSALRANGFRQEGRIADFYRPGVGLLFLRCEMTG